MSTAKLIRRMITCMLLLSASLLVPASAQETDSLNKQLFAATENGDILAVERLLRAGANVEARATNGVTPLMTAAERGNVPLVGLLLDRGANPRTTDEQNETALTHAARGGLVRVVSLLAPLSDTKEKNRALFWAVEGGPVTIEIAGLPARSAQLPTQSTEDLESSSGTVETLLDNGAEIEARNEDGGTPLIWAASFAQTDIFKLLVQRGARVNVTDRDGNTPLMAAACQCAEATMNSVDNVVRMLLDQGAKVNARNHEGATALMLASGMAGDPKILEVLLSNGADPRLKDKSGKTALSYAKESRREDKIQVLKRAVLQAR